MGVVWGGELPVQLLVLAVATATAMIGAVMLSVLLFPLVGLMWARMDTKAVAAEAI